MLRSTLSRRTALVLVAVSSLFGVACAGERGPRTFTASDADSHAPTAFSAPTSAGCVAGETKSCTIFLGRHGDLANCEEGLDVCSGGEWTGCISESALAENAELVSQLMAE
jgi:hypothetical protein